MNEADTCRTYLIPKLIEAGWEDDTIAEQLVLTPGRIVPIGERYTRKQGLRSDYLFSIRQNRAMLRQSHYASEELSALMPSILDKAFRGEFE